MKKKLSFAKITEILLKSQVSDFISNSLYQQNLKCPSPFTNLAFNGPVTHLQGSPLLPPPPLLPFQLACPGGGRPEVQCPVGSGQPAHQGRGPGGCTGITQQGQLDRTEQLGILDNSGCLITTSTSICFSFQLSTITVPALTLHQ